MKRRITKMNNIPEVKLGLIAVSRDCFPISLSSAPRGHRRRLRRAGKPDL
jgi:hypothetical protein